MPYTNVSSLSARRSHFLNIAPMISALEFQPADFEYKRGWLRHVPSRHRSIRTRDDRRTVRLRERAGQLRAGRGTLCRLQGVAAALLAAARNRPGIRLALPHP